MSSLKETPWEQKELVLVVDDVLETTEVIRRNLEREGYIVVTASSVDEAIVMLCEFPVDLVITDVMMPGKSVTVLLGHLKSHGRQPPVIVVSGYPMTGDEGEIVKAGARECITKPFTDEELLRAVRAVMENLRGGKSDSRLGRSGC